MGFFLLLKLNNATNETCAGLGAFLLVREGAGQDTSTTACMGLGGFLLSARGGGYSRSGLPPAQVNLHAAVRVAVSISI